MLQSTYHVRTVQNRVKATLTGKTWRSVRRTRSPGLPVKGEGPGRKKPSKVWGMRAQVGSLVIGECATSPHQPIVPRPACQILKTKHAFLQVYRKQRVLENRCTLH